MSRKILLSFLGTSNYLPVRYYFEAEGQKDHFKVEKFIQKSLLDGLSKQFNSGDIAVIFLTPEAQKRNWEAPENDLAAQVEAQKYPFQVRHQMVSDESNTEAIRATFMALYDALEPGDQVFLDITHSWRYLPLLGSTLLSYAKALKGIEVKAIYYGALERLGKPKAVEEIVEENRWVPILNLVGFSELQDWSSAAREFVDSGNPERWIQLAGNHINPILRESGGQNTTMRNLNRINKQIGQLATNIATNRGQKLLEFKFAELDDTIRNIAEEEQTILPLKPILSLVRNKVTPFVQAGHLTWLESVRWCMEHNLIQQAYTQMQEGMLTWLCTRFQRIQIFPDFFDWKKEAARSLLSSVLNLYGDDLPPTEWKGALAKHQEIGMRIFQDPIIKTLAPPFKTLTGARNDINHGGYTANRPSEKFIGPLENMITDLSNILIAEEQKLTEHSRFLLNLSNHPFAQWDTQQQQAASEAYNRVEDMEFPKIPADFSEEALGELAETYLQQILEKNPTAVHLMGEMTFTFLLVGKLKALSIPCIASTSFRDVIDHGEGRKEVQFRFVRFREY